MFIVKRLAGLALTAALGLVPAACAQQDSQPPMAGMNRGMQGGQQGASGENIRGAGNTATGNMQGHDMSGMDMGTMMNHCADMRRQMAQGTMGSAPDMQRMMAQCDQMDRQMGAMPGMGTQTPAGTRSR